MNRGEQDDSGGDNGIQEQSSAPVFSARAARLRSEYGLIRGEIKRRPERFTGFNHTLARARIDQRYDEYLVRTVRRAALGAFTLMGLQVVFVLGLLSQPIGLESPRRFTLTHPGTVVAVILLVSLGGGLTFSLIHYNYPRMKASQRQRHIDSALPHGIVFMYALSEGGVELPLILKKLSQSEDVFGEIAHEFRGITTDLERFNFGLLAALDEGKHLTPSETYRDFLDDLMSVLQSGGELNTFLRNKSESHLELARRQQDNFLETLGTLAEVYVTLIIAGPIFLIITLTIFAFTGSNTLIYVKYLTYVGIPIGIISFIALFDILDPQYESTVTAPVPSQSEKSREEIDPENPEQTAYFRNKWKRSIKRFLKEPFRVFKGQPLRSFVITIPIVVLCLMVLVFSGATSLSVDASQEQPIWTTTVVVIFPLLLLSGGIMVIYEIERRRIAAINRRFPDLLASLASANRNGIHLADCISLATHRSEGVLAQYLERLETDIQANRSLHEALQRFAVEVDVSRVTRVIKTIIESDKSSEDISSILETIASDTEKRYRLDLDRKQAMQEYVVIFFIGVLVYLMMIYVISGMFFPILSELPAGELMESPGSRSGSVPITAFQTTLYHSSIIHSFGNGLLIGKLVEDNVLGGIKYAIPLLLVTTAVFYIV